MPVAEHLSTKTTPVYVSEDADDAFNDPLSSLTVN